MTLEFFRTHLFALARSLDYELKDDRALDFYNALRNMNQEQFVRICEYQRDNFIPKPHSRFPLIGNFKEAMAFTRQENQEFETEDIPENEMATVGEIHWHAKVMNEIHLWYELKLGRPIEMIKRMSDGSIVPRNRTIAGRDPKALENYYHEYYDRLVSKRGNLGKGEPNGN